MFIGSSRASSRGLVCLLLWLVFALVGQTVVRAQASELEAKELFERGVAASHEKDWARARDLFERSQSLVPKYSTLLNLAIAHLRLGQVDRTLSLLARLETQADPVEHADLLSAAALLRAEAKATDTSTPLRAGPAATAPRAARAEEASDPREGLAREAFAAGRYQEAIDLFAKLYAERAHPNYLHNIGRCYQNLGEAERAIASFREFLRKADRLPADARAQVEGYIAEMERLRESQAQASRAQVIATPMVAVPAEPAVAGPSRPVSESARPALPELNASAPAGSTFVASPTWRKPLAVGVLGASVLALGVGSYFGVRSLHAYDDAERRCPTRQACSVEALSSRDDAQRFAWLANGGIALGSVLAITGTILFFKRPRAHSKVPPQGSTAVHVHLNGLSMEQMF